MTAMYQQLFTFPALETSLYPGIMLVAFLISSLFATLGALRGARRVIDLSPAEAMRAAAPPVMDRILLEKLPGLWQRFDFRWQIVLRTIFRNRGRSLIGMTAAALGAAMIVLAMGMYDSVSYMVAFQFDKVLLADYNLSLGDCVAGTAVAEIRKTPGVTRVEPRLEVAVDFHHLNQHKKGVITGLLPGARLTIPCAGNGVPAQVPDHGLLVTGRLARELGVAVGDRLNFTPIKGRRLAQSAPVTGIVESTFGLAVYADYYYLNRLVGEEDALNSIQLQARFNRQQRENFYRQVKDYPGLSSLSATAALKNRIEGEFTSQMLGMIYIMVLFAGVIFFGSILNSALISLAEKQREIATFRILGYQSPEVGSIFLREVMLINLSGALLGLPLGWAMLYGMCQGFCNDVFAPALSGRAPQLAGGLPAGPALYRRGFCHHTAGNRPDELERCSENERVTDNGQQIHATDN